MTTKTIASVGLALILTAITTTGADARRHEKPATYVPVYDRHGVHGYAPAVHLLVASPRQDRVKRKLRDKREKAKSAVASRPTLAGYGSHIAKTASLDHVTPRLAAKAREIVAACGAKVISAYRPGACVRGYGTPSLHSRYPAQAIDMTGDTSCIYPRLRGWAGGYSVDYAAVKHIHISDASDRRERGARFVHYGTRRYARR